MKCFAAFLLFASTASAQQVRGIIRDSATAGPIPGVIASLLDSAGRPLARTIADEQGRYRLPALASAARLQALRIGYRPREVRLRANPSGGDVTVDVTMVPVAKFLETVRVSDRA